MPDFVDIIMPQSQEGTQSVIANWLKRPGDAVRENEPLIEISTDKVTMEVAAPSSGVLKEIVTPENTQVKPGELLGRIEIGVVSKQTSTSSVQKSSKPGTQAAQGPKVAIENISPVVRKLIKEYNLDPAAIDGSGKDGRITHEDVIRHIEAKARGEKSQSEAKSLQGKRVPHNPMRKMIANHMVESMLHTAPHVTTVFQADLSRVMADQKAKESEFAKQGVKLTLTSYFIQATVAALKAVPQVNSRWHDDATEIFEECNIGIATALGDQGLIVPVLHGAEQLDLFDTAKALQDLVSKARNNSLTSADIQGGTFTITNHGVSGSLIATPIINQPQSAILGIGKMEKRPIVIEQGGKDELSIRPMVYVTLTIDHRLLDGFVANSFLSAFVKNLESY